MDIDIYVCLYLYTVKPQTPNPTPEQYFDELRTLLPCGADSKFDKNTILQNTIAMIKQLQVRPAHIRQSRPARMRQSRPDSGAHKTVTAGFWHR